MEALVSTFLNYGNVTVVDVCSPQGSGILDWFEGSNVTTKTCHNAFVDKVEADWIIYNPPYKRPLVDDIVTKQIARAVRGEVRGVAALLRTQFDHAKTRTHMFRDCPNYAGQIKMMFRPIWFEDGDSTPIHNYVWHIWKSEPCMKQIWYA
jgi:predicted methyltransferase MtxX (methanogen marker protein 4)